MNYKFNDYNMRAVPGLPNTWDVYWYGSVMRQVCQVEIMPAKTITFSDKDALFGNPRRMYKVTAENYPLVGKLEQVVRGEDLHTYLESVRMAVIT